MSAPTYKGGCFCGEVQFVVTGPPHLMGLCHCVSCRTWSAAPVNAFSLWKPENVKVTQGEGNIGVYNKTERSFRQFCRTCGGHLMTRHPLHNFFDVYAALLPELSFAGSFHVFYGERMLSWRDGLPKFRDLPAELGGSGETLPE